MNRDMARSRDGSLLVVVLVAVSVVTLLAVAAGLMLRAQAARLVADRDAADRRLAARNAAARCVAERLAVDTNGWDALSEAWCREPWELREGGWILRVSGSGWSPVPGGTVGLIDEERRLDLNRADEDMLRALGVLAAGLEEEAAARLAAATVAWRERPTGPWATGVGGAGADGRNDAAHSAARHGFTTIEELLNVPGMTDDILARLRPHVTVHGCGRVNVNTASDAVLRSLLEAAAAGDRGAVAGLFDRLRAHRASGHVFASAASTAIGRELMGLPADQAALLGRAEPGLTAESTAFSGVAEAWRAADFAAGRKGGRAAFVWDRAGGRFVRWVEE